MNDFASLLAAHGPRLPLFIAFLVGVALSIAQRRQLGIAAGFAGVGFALQALAWLIGTGLSVWQMLRIADGGTYADVARLFGFVSLFSTLLHLTGVVLILCALFYRRPHAGLAADVTKHPQSS